MLTGKKWGHTFDLEDGATVEFDDATEVIAITSIDADFGPQTSLLCDGGAFVLTNSYPSTSATAGRHAGLTGRFRLRSGG